MDLRPWVTGVPTGRLSQHEEIVRQLKRVISSNPNPGACHYYIHAGRSGEPESGGPCAERLARLMPGRAHGPHARASSFASADGTTPCRPITMPSIPTKNSSTGSGPRGLSARVLSAQHPLPRVRLHDGGRSTQAIEAAHALAAKVNLDAARHVAMLQEMVPYHALTLTTFGKWDAVLAEPLPPEDLRFSYAMAQYARGVASAATGAWAGPCGAREGDGGRRRDARRAEGRRRSRSPCTLGEIATRRGTSTRVSPTFGRRSRSRTRDSTSNRRSVLPIRHSLGAR